MERKRAAEWLAGLTLQGYHYADVELMDMFAAIRVREELEAVIALCNRQIETARLADVRSISGPLELTRNRLIERLAELDAAAVSKGDV